MSNKIYLKEISARKYSRALARLDSNLIYISSEMSFSRVMTLNFAPRPKRAFIRWPVLFGAGCSDGVSRGCSRTQMA